MSYNIYANPKGGGSCDPPWRAYHHRIAVIKAASASTASIINLATSKAVGFLFTLTFTFISPPPFCLYYNILLAVCQELFTELSNNLQKDAHNAHKLYAIMLS